MSCSQNCPTQDHASYGECLRNKGVRIAYTNEAGGWDYSKQLRWDRELETFRNAVAEGLTPEGTTYADIDRAKRAADTTQTASGTLEVPLFEDD